MNSNVIEYISKHEKWKNELSKIRELMLTLPVEETLKWGAPFYTHGGKNIVGFSAFKNHFGVWFPQGALLKDDFKVLINAQEGKTTAMRQWRMKSNADIDLEVLKMYVLESIQNKEEGKVIKPKKKELIIEEPLLTALESNQKLKTMRPLLF